MEFFQASFRRLVAELLEEKKALKKNKEASLEQFELFQSKPTRFYEKIHPIATVVPQ